MNDESPDAVIQAMLLAELGPWVARRIDYDSAVSEYQWHNATRATLFLYRISGGRVAIADKPPFCTRAQLDADESELPWVNAAIAYRRFIQAVVTTTRPATDTVLAVDVSDEGFSSATAPIFVIQKRKGASSVLLPHYEFIYHRFHEAEADDTEYPAKSITAVFIGSTTGGGYVTAQAVRDLSLPRLRSAMHFRDNPRVVFRLPILVQCAPEAERLLRQMGFGEGRGAFSEHFPHRFIIAMDGNAGTCSRVTVGLKSNSALLKYESDHVMHYFGQMIPWRHYIPIAADRDVEAVLDWEQRQPGRFAHVAREGARFFDQCLRRERIVDYMAGLISGYAEAFERPGA